MSENGRIQCIECMATFEAADICPNCGATQLISVGCEGAHEVRLTSIKGTLGIAIGEESIFLNVERATKGWRIRLIDLRAPPIIPTSSWVKLDEPSKLATARKAAFLRDILKKNHPDTVKQIIDRVIATIQDNEKRFELEEEDDQNAEQEDVSQEALKRKPLTADEAAEIDEILNSPQPLEKMEKLLKDIGAGEMDNKKLLLLLLTSGLNKNPKEKEIILIKSRAGAGKTTLISTLVKFFKTKTVGRFSEHALDHTNLEGFNILYLKEIGHMDEEKQGVSTLKFLSVDDQGYTAELTIGSPSEGWTTVTKRIPPMTVVSSTTRVEIDPQFERRCWIIYLDESEAQTERIRKWNTKQEIETLEIAIGLRSELSRKRAQRLLQALVEKISPFRVSVVFSKVFLGVLEKGRLRTRGDYGKLLRLLKYYSRLRHETLPTLNGQDGAPILFATPWAAIDILKTAWAPITLMTSGLDQRTKKLLDGFETLGWKDKGCAIKPDDRAELAMSLGYSSSTIREYLNNLEKVNFLSSDSKKPKTYWLLKSLAIIRREAGSLSTKLDNGDGLIREMCEEAQETLETLSLKKPEGALDTIIKYFDASQSPRNYNTYAHPPTIFSDSELGIKQPQTAELNENNPQYPVLAITNNAETVNGAQRNNNPPRGTLQENLDKIIHVIGEAENPLTSRTASDTVYTLLKDVHDIGRLEAEKLIHTCMRDGTIYSPSPGYFKLSMGGE